MDPLVLAYYCSGHGYGHATRVSAFTRHLLSLPVPLRVHIVSSAPPHVFADSLALGAAYRYAEIDPVIVQPLAYRVDRVKSVHVLRRFLDKKDALVRQESSWLTSINARAVLTDAAFLACLAASASSIPSVLLTNFTFDSVYSFLSTPLLDLPPPTSATLPHIPSLHRLPPSAPPSPARLDLDNVDHHPPHPPPLSLPPPLDPQEQDSPIPLELLRPLTQQLLDGYTHADLLVLLPGAIPIPSFPFPIHLDQVSAGRFSVDPDKSVKAPILPSSEWVDPATRRTIENVQRWMKAVVPLPHLESTYLTPNVTAMTASVVSTTNDSVSERKQGQKQRRRQVIHAPLIVRPPSAGISSCSSTSSLSSSFSSVDPSPSPISSQSSIQSQDGPEKHKQNPYTPEGRSALLASIGVPEHLHDPETTRILVVSFGGQVFRCLPGSHSHSHSHSHGSPHGSPHRSHGLGSGTHSRRASREVSSKEVVNGHAAFLEGSLSDVKKEIKKPANKKTKEIDVLKPLDPNSIEGLTNKKIKEGYVGARLSQAQHRPVSPNVNGSSVPGINNNTHGDIGIGPTLSMTQTGETLSLPAATALSPLPLPLPPSPSPSPPRCCPSPPHRIATPCHIWIPGAPAPVPLAPLPFPPPLIETTTKTKTAGVLRRRTIAAVGSSSSAATAAAARALRVTADSERRGRGGCKRSASLSVSVSVSVSLAGLVSRSRTRTRTRDESWRKKVASGAVDDVEKRSESANGHGNGNGNVPSVVTIPPTPLSVAFPTFHVGSEKEEDENENENENEKSGEIVLELEDDEHIKQHKEEEYTFLEEHHLDIEEEEYDEYEYGAEGSMSGEGLGLGLVPDGSWIAIVCGMSGSGSGSGKEKKEKTRGSSGTGTRTKEGKDQEEKEKEEEEDFLPEGFYVAPRDVYMPDLMAVADVLLGKLGYGTVSECVDACTPFIYVSRPLFIEEHGLRLLLDQEGVGVELSREAYEQGEWAMAISEAWVRGREAKEAKRRREREMAVERRQNMGGRGDKRQEEARKLACKVVDWVRDWWGDQVN